MLSRDQLRRWFVGNLMWWVFWLCGGAVVTAIAGAVSGLTGFWAVLFTIGVFGMATASLFGLSKIALVLIPAKYLSKPTPPTPPDVAERRATLDRQTATLEREQRAMDQERTRALRVSLHEVLGEVEYGHKMIAEAERKGLFWSPFQRKIPNDKWAFHSRTIGAEERCVPAYRSAERAYHEFDRLGHAVDAHAQAWREDEGGNFPLEDFLAVTETDDVAAAISAAATAEVHLTAALNLVGADS